MDSLPEKIIMQNSNEISKLTLPEKIKIISDFVPYNIRDVESNCRCKIEGADNRKSHVHALFYYQPSTPERILQTLLRDYMCLKSLHMAAKTVR